METSVHQRTYLYKVSIWNIYITYINISMIQKYIIISIMTYLWNIRVQVCGNSRCKFQIINPILPPNIDWLNSQRLLRYWGAVLSNCCSMSLAFPKEGSQKSQSELIGAFAQLILLIGFGCSRFMYHIYIYILYIYLCIWYTPST